MNEIVEIFNSFMHGEHSVVNSIGKLLRVYEKSNFDDFRKSIAQCVNCILLRSHKSKSMAKTADLLVGFLTAPEILKGDCATLEVSNEDIEPIFYAVLRDTLYHHEASCRFVRFEVCNILDKIFDSLPKDAKLEVDFLNDVGDKIRLRIHDISPNVRVKAISIVSRIQDLDNEDCPIINELINLLEYDTNEHTRKIAATNVCVTHKSLPFLINRVFDIKPSVRVVIYDRLAKYVPVRVLTIDQRVKVVNAGLAEKEQSTAAAFRRLVVDSWFLNSCARDIIVFINLFDVEEDNELLSRLVNFIFKNIQISDFENILSVFSYDEISTQILSDFKIENIFIFCHSLAYVIENQDTINLPFKITNSLPEISKICALIENLIKNNFNIFVLKEIFKLLRVFDLSDEAGRKIAIDLMLKILSRPGEYPAGFQPDGSFNCLDYLQEVVRTYVLYATDHITTLDTVAEVVSEIRQPINAGIFSQGTGTQKFEEFTQTLTQTSNENTEILITCLAIINEVLKIRNLDLTTPSAVSLLEFFVLPLVKDERCDVRIEAVRCLSLFCIYVRNYAVKYFVLLSRIAKIDGKEIKNVAISAIFDIYTLYGSSFNSDSEDENYLELIDSLLEDKNDENDIERLLILTCGVAKLFLLRRIFAPKTLSYLIKSYLNPTCQSSLQIKCVLSQFFNIYLKQKFSDCFDIFIKACLITIEELAQKNTATVSTVTQLANLLTNFTKFELKKTTDENNEVNLREKLVLALLEAFLNNEINSDIPLFIIKKILTSFNILVVTEEGIAQAKEITEKIIQKLTEENDARTISWIKKLQERLVLVNFAEPLPKTDSNTTIIESQVVK